MAAKQVFQIDLNCDMGESYGRLRSGNDMAVFPYITSCNVACGFHAGDPLHIENTILQGKAHQLQIGAHPSYPDLAGFGRRYMKIEPAEFKAMIRYQLAAIKGICNSFGVQLKYVKAHGALYNRLADDAEEATLFVEAVQSIDPNLAILGLPNSALETLVKSNGMHFIREGFADRQYTASGRLLARTAKQAVIADPLLAAAQFKQLVTTKSVQTVDGSTIPMEVDSICIHGDHPRVVDVLESIHAMAKVEEIGFNPPAPVKKEER